MSCPATSWFISQKKTSKGVATDVDMITFPYLKFEQTIISSVSTGGKRRLRMVLYLKKMLQLNTLGQVGTNLSVCLSFFCRPAQRDKFWPFQRFWPIDRFNESFLWCFADCIATELRERKSGEKIMVEVGAQGFYGCFYGCLISARVSTRVFVPRTYATGVFDRRTGSWSAHQFDVFDRARCWLRRKLRWRKLQQKRQKAGKSELVSDIEIHGLYRCNNMSLLLHICYCYSVSMTMILPRIITRSADPKPWWLSRARIRSLRADLNPCVRPCAHHLAKIVCLLAICAWDSGIRLLPLVTYAAVFNALRFPSLFWIFWVARRVYAVWILRLEPNHSEGPLWGALVTALCYWLGELPRCGVFWWCAYACTDQWPKKYGRSSPFTSDSVHSGSYSVTPFHRNTMFSPELVAKVSSLARYHYNIPLLWVGTAQTWFLGYMNLYASLIASCFCWWSQGLVRIFLRSRGLCSLKQW